jgi:Tfp pilus assembly protein PilF
VRFSLSILLVVVLSACAEKQSSAQDHLARARDYLTASDSNAAEIELKNTLQREPATGEARFLLGTLYLDKDENPAAEKELLRAQELGWSADAVRPALARAWLGQAKNAEVLALDYTTLADQAAVRLLCIQAIAALMEGKRAQAVDLVALARTKDPESPEAKTAEARMLALQGDATRALMVIDEVLAAAPHNAEAWRLKANVLSRQQKLEEARAAFDQSIANSTVSFTDYLYMAFINIHLQDFAKA